MFSDGVEVAAVGGCSRGSKRQSSVRRNGQESKKQNLMKKRRSVEAAVGVGDSESWQGTNRSRECHSDSVEVNRVEVVEDQRSRAACEGMVGNQGSRT